VQPTTTPVDRPPTGEPGPRPVGAFILIALGLALLVANMLPAAVRGGVVLLGLGLAFLLGRLLTGRYGLAVPAGILLALGALAALAPADLLVGSGAGQRPNGGAFFLVLGLGFVLVYLIGARPRAVWPLFPAAVLILVGLMFYGVGLLGAIRPPAWTPNAWPALLILVGAWLLLRDHMPAALHRPVAVLGAAAILAYALLVGATLVDTSTTARSLTAGLGSSVPAADERITLTAPISAGGTLRVENGKGTTVVHGGGGAEVSVVAVRHAGGLAPLPEVHLTPDGPGARLTSTQPDGGWFGFGGGWVDYQVDLPASSGVDVQSGSGDVTIDNVAGPITVQSGSGDVSVAGAQAASVRTGSGSVRLAGVAGDLRVATGSGSVRGTELAHVREVGTGSGSVDLSGTFVDDATVRTSSGTVELRLAPGSSVRISASSSSGDVRGRGPSLANVQRGGRALSAVVGDGRGQLTIQTSSGSISLSG
jgi:Putative adhesin